jgi:hypothetical protein
MWLVEKITRALAVAGLVLCIGFAAVTYAWRERGQAASVKQSAIIQRQPVGKKLQAGL